MKRTYSLDLFPYGTPITSPYFFDSQCQDNTRGFDSRQDGWHTFVCSSNSPEEQVWVFHTVKCAGQGTLYTECWQVFWVPAHAVWVGIFNGIKSQGVLVHNISPEPASDWRAYEEGGHLWIHHCFVGGVNQVHPGRGQRHGCAGTGQDYA